MSLLRRRVSISAWHSSASNAFFFFFQQCILNSLCGLSQPQLSSKLSQIQPIFVFCFRNFASLITSVQFTFWDSLGFLNSQNANWLPILARVSYVFDCIPSSYNIKKIFKIFLSLAFWIETNSFVLPRPLWWKSSKDLHPPVSVSMLTFRIHVPLHRKWVQLY